MKKEKLLNAMELSRKFQLKDYMSGNEGGKLFDDSSIYNFFWGEGVITLEFHIEVCEIKTQKCHDILLHTFFS